MTRKLGKEVVLRLARDIKPVVKTKDPNKTFFAGGGLFYVAPVEISAHLSKREMTPILKVGGELVKLCEITTEHATVGYKGKFAPSIEETLEEIYNKAPQTLLSQVVAYSTTQIFNVAHEIDPNRPVEIGKTTLYGVAVGKKLPKAVETQDVIFNGVVYKNDNSRSK